MHVCVNNKDSAHLSRTEGVRLHIGHHSLHDLRVLREARLDEPAKHDGGDNAKQPIVHVLSFGCTAAPSA